MELKRRVDLVPVLVEDLKELLVFMFIEDEYANPGAQHHRLDHILWDASLFALHDRVVDLFHNEEVLAIFLLPRSRRPPKPCVGSRARRFDLLDAVLDQGSNQNTPRSVNQTVVDLVEEISNGSHVDMIEAMVIGRILFAAWRPPNDCIQPHFAEYLL
jgi:hypothetical protein